MSPCASLPSRAYIRPILAKRVVNSIDLPIARLHTRRINTARPRASKQPKVTSLLPCSSHRAMSRSLAFNLERAVGVATTDRDRAN